MKVTRCKDCVYQFTHECLLAVIEKRTLTFINRSETFFCGKAKRKDNAVYTNGDAIRDMTDKQLAHFLNEIELDAFRLGTGGGKMNGSQVEWWENHYLKTEEGAENIE